MKTLISFPLDRRQSLGNTKRIAMIDRLTSDTLIKHRVFKIAFRSLKHQKIYKRINVPFCAPRNISRTFRRSRRRAHSSSFLSVQPKITYRSRMISNQTELVYVQFSLFTSIFYIHSSELCFIILNSR